MYFLSISFRNLWRRPIRSCLTAMGVAVAVATLIALVGTSQGVEHAWSKSMAGRGIHMLGFRKNTVEILSSTINQSVVEQIGRIAGIKAATGELADLVKLDAGGDRDLRVVRRQFSLGNHTDSKGTSAGGE